MKKDALAQSTNTATNSMLSFFNSLNAFSAIYNLRKSGKFLENRLRESILLKEFSNDIFSMFDLNINNKYTLFNVFNSLVEIITQLINSVIVTYKTDEKTVLEDIVYAKLFLSNAAGPIILSVIISSEGAILSCN